MNKEEKFLLKEYIDKKIQIEIELAKLNPQTGDYFDRKSIFDRLQEIQDKIFPK